MVDWVTVVAVAAIVSAVVHCQFGGSIGRGLSCGSKPARRQVVSHLPVLSPCGVR